MRLVNFLVCDDIRNEIGNNHSVMGIYDDSINFAVPIANKGVWPKGNRLGIYIKAKFDSTEEKVRIKKFEVDSILNSNSKKIAEGNIDMGVKTETSGFNLAIVFSQFIFEAAGILRLRIRLLDDSGNEVQVYNSPEDIKIGETIM